MIGTNFPYGAEVAEVPEEQFEALSQDKGSMAALICDINSDVDLVISLSSNKLLRGEPFGRQHRRLILVRPSLRRGEPHPFDVHCRDGCQFLLDVRRSARLDRHLCSLAYGFFISRLSTCESHNFVSQLTSS